MYIQSQYLIYYNISYNYSNILGYNLYMLVNFFKHLSTVHNHRMIVMKMAFKCHMYYQGLTHDLSKYTPTELFISAKYFLGYRSPIGNERKHIGYSRIYLHHKGRNKHHAEYWFDPYAKNRRIIMPDKYILESVLDRIAAAKNYLKDDYYDGAAYDYYLKDKQITDYLHEEEKDKFSYLLIYLKDNGEEKLLKLIKNLYKEGSIK